MRDLLVVVAIAGAASGAIGLGGLVALRLRRRRSLRASLVIVAVVTVLAMIGGMVATAQAMFLSAHDLAVAVVVAVISGGVALILALTLGRIVVADSRALAAAVRQLGDSSLDAGQPRALTAELAQVSEQLAHTGQRLTESRARERALEQSRRELVAWVSHDLRTPLAGLRAMAEALEDAVAADPRRYHRQIRTEVDRLAAMVDDLFELSRIQAGALRLSLGRVGLADLVSDALAGAQPLAAARRVRLLGKAEAPAAVTADGTAIGRALVNLVMNAIRHTPSDGTVEVVAEIADEHALFAVSDACGGIPEPDLGRLFEVGWRGTHARTPGPDGGAGLGLAITQGIVEAHHGDIRVENTGVGCRFEVRLPVVGVPSRKESTGQPR
jgi:signal transduction histidine kinase